MPIALDGENLNLEQLMKIAHEKVPVELAPVAKDRLRAARATVERAFASGERVYGLNTGVGVLKRVELIEDVAQFNRRLLEFHQLGQGASQPHHVVRAAMARLINQFALGTTAVRLELAEHLVSRLNEDVVVDVRTIGGGLCTNADLALGYVGDFPLAQGEGLAMLGHSALGDAQAALAVSDMLVLADSMEAALALALEAFRAKITPLDERVVALKRGAGVARSAANVREHLAGTNLWEAGQSRNLQDPLSFRCGAYVIGAFRDAVSYGLELMINQLNSSCSNPVVIAEAGEILHAANWEVQAVTSMLDFMKIALAPAITMSQERSIKLLDRLWSGLPTGLVGSEEQPESGLAMLQALVQAYTVELRLAASPASFEISSSSNAEGIEDRLNWSQQLGQRVMQIHSLAVHVLAIELLVSAQAVELRGLQTAGSGVKRIWAKVREAVPFLEIGQALPRDLTGLVRQLNAGEYSLEEAVVSHLHATGARSLRIEL